ncbi:FUSC family protein [Enterococcus faecalis]|uniref:CD3337/EF1877 family mobilome membrane protein n=1 Tax=Enterococcus TaxID=1350 RepID=UPI001A97A90C|nr:FUSC family protein [Enterococcus faecalis]MBO1126588.1 FUSC family protein [Enterococcus faecalis]
MNRKRAVKILLLVVGIFFLVSLVSIPSQAAGLIDETIDSTNNYSKYPVDNYQLDYFVDSSWDWLPWNWGDGIGKSVMYGIYAITNLIWLFSVYLSNATGYLVGEAYSLDFISDTTEAIGRNIQTLAGINENGFMATGFYPGMLLLLILIIGIYVTYTGLIKRETTKAIGALTSFLTIFLLSSAFIAYSTSYISRINEFSADISNAALDVGSRMTMPNSESNSKSSVDAIRDSLFEIQVKQPWMILQYGDSDSEAIAAERVESLESTSPFANKGKDRIEIVKKEINDNDNDNMTITKTINRLGVAIFIFLFNIFISVFVFILTGIMIFSQILFIIFAVFLPISFLLSMIPSFNHLMKTTIMRLFNVIMMRAGITLVLTISFSLSAMVYSLTVNQPFFIVAFLQIVVFAGIYFKLNDLMGMMALNSGDSQSIGGRVMRRPKQTARRTIRKLAIGGLALKGLGFSRKESAKKNEPDKKKKQERSKENPSQKKRQQPENNTLPVRQKQSGEKKGQTNQRRTTKQSNSKEHSPEKKKQEAARKFKQASLKETKPENKRSISETRTKKNRDVKRKKAPMRTLEKTYKTPVKHLSPSTEQREGKRKSNVSSKATKDISNTKNASKLPPSNSSNRKSVSNKQTHSLDKGKAIQREVNRMQEERKTTNKGLSTKKNEEIQGKGAKRK